MSTSASSIGEDQEHGDRNAAYQGAQEHEALAAGVRKLSPEGGEDEHADRGDRGACAHPKVQPCGILHPEVTDEERNDRYDGVETYRCEGLCNKNGVKSPLPVWHCSGGNGR
jgi:hypothetical protein